MSEKKPKSGKVLIDPDKPHAWLKKTLSFNHPYRFGAPIEKFASNDREVKAINRIGIYTAGDMLAYVYTLQAGSLEPPGSIGIESWRALHKKIRAHFDLDQVNHNHLKNGSILSSTASEKIKGMVA